MVGSRLAEFDDGRRSRTPLARPRMVTADRPESGCWGSGLGENIVDSDGIPSLRPVSISTVSLTTYSLIDDTMLLTTSRIYPRLPSLAPGLAS